MDFSRKGTERFRLYRLRMWLGLRKAYTEYGAITSSKSLTDLLLQCLEAYQIFFVSLMDLAGSVVRCGGFCAD